jgi:hypothetical protein
VFTFKGNLFTIHQYELSYLFIPILVSTILLLFLISNLQQNNVYTLVQFSLIQKFIQNGLYDILI